MAEIPVFKERRMTATLDDGGLSSYNVKDSYVGILRLSPNNVPSLEEQDNYADISENLLTYASFTDSVTDILPQQMIRISTSDGVLLDMRIGKDEIEYDNLYIRGALKTSSIITYGSFEMNGVKMPSTYNTEDPKISDSPALSKPITTENVGEAYVLVNTSKDGEPAQFEYKNARDLINQFIEDALSKLSTLPTGSIHWIPVNLQQYKALLNGEGNKHNGTGQNNNTLIRDFLLCDGKEYNSVDFPELAKILNGEKITRWSEEGNYMKKEEKICGENYKFCVPDLRSMFIEYIVPIIEHADASNNRAGYWGMDSCKDQEVIIHEKADTHYHYLVLDNTIKNNSNTIRGNGGNKGFTLGEFGPLAKYGSGQIADTRWVNGDCRKYCDWFKNPYGYIRKEQGILPSIIYKPYDFSYGWCAQAQQTCGYILTGNYTKNPSISIGLSSTAKTDTFDDLKPSDDNLNYTKSASDNKLILAKHDEIYKKPKTYVSYDDALLGLRGKENTPEFYACLPLIKI